MKSVIDDAVNRNLDEGGEEIRQALFRKSSPTSLKALCLLRKSL